MIKKRIQDIKRGINTPNGRTVINDFWEKHSDTLKGLSLQNKVSHSLILESMMKTAASTNKRGNEYQMETRRQERRIEEWKDSTEFDSVFASSQTTSMVTVIKKLFSSWSFSAQELHLQSIE